MRPLDDKTIAAIPILYELGLTGAQVRERLGIGHSSFTKYLAAAGVKADPGARMRGRPLGPRQPSWKGDAAHPDAKRARAQRLYPELGMCEECRAAHATDRHHVDGDTGNNAAENIMRLCRRCHMRIDGRLDRFRDAGGGRGRTCEPKPCMTCSKPYKPLRRGLCARCYDRQRRKNAAEVAA